MQDLYYSTENTNVVWNCAYRLIAKPTVPAYENLPI